MATWTKETKTHSDFDVKGFLLQECLDFLLLETGKKIVVGRGLEMKHTSSWSNITKH